MAKNILEEALADAKLLRESAFENARNALVEAIAPDIKKMVESQLGEPQMGLPVEADSMYEKHDDEEDKALLLKLLGQGLMSKDEVLGAMPEASDEADDVVGVEFSADSDDEASDEEGESDNEDEEESESDEDEDEDEGDEDMKNESNEEVVEIAESDLKAAFSEVLGDVMKSLKTEATVSAGFGDAEEAEEGGLLDKQGGEKQFADVDVPAAKDWTVKEASLKKEIARLKNENSEYKKACDYLTNTLKEVNLFNSKLVYTNKLLQNTQLNSKQRSSVIERVDEAQSLREVELIYKSLSESFKISGVVNESKAVKPVAKGAKASRFTAPSATVLKEQAEKEVDQIASRWEQLAGLID